MLINVPDFWYVGFRHASFWHAVSSLPLEFYLLRGWHASFILKIDGRTCNAFGACRVSQSRNSERDKHKINHRQFHILDGIGKQGQYTLRADDLVIFAR